MKAVEEKTEKRCYKCGETKPVAAFAKNRTKKDGLQNLCRVCNAKASKASRMADSEPFNNRTADWARRNPLANLWKEARRRAAVKGIPFELPHWKEMKVEPACALCFKPFEDNNNRDGKKIQPRSRTLDRILPSEGYTVANVVQICSECNTAKAYIDVRTNTVGIITWATRVKQLQLDTWKAIKQSNPKTKKGR
jgi:hypothetical protein